MKIICDTCGAKYSIADEKVRGKVFKIRCKKCSEIIVVRGTSETSEAEAQPQAAAQTYDSGAYAADAAVWHVVLEGEQQGPYTAEQVGQFVAAGQLDYESYCWRDGFGDWAHVRDVAELMAALGGGAGAAAAPEMGAGYQDQLPTVSGGPDAGAGAYGGGYGDQDAGYGADYGAGEQAGAFDGDTVHSDQHPVGFTAPASEDPAAATAQQAVADLFGAGGGAPAAAPRSAGQGFAAPSAAPQAARGAADPGADLFAAQQDEGGGMFPAESPDVMTSSPRVEVNRMTGTRNENSVLFSLSNLQALASGAQPAAAQSAEPMAAPRGASGPTGMAMGGTTEGSGLIDIRSMAAAAAEIGEGGGVDDLLSIGGGGGFAPTLGAPVLMAQPPERSNKLVIALIAVGGLVVLAVAAVVIVLLTRPQPGMDDAVVAAAAQQQVLAPQIAGTPGLPGSSAAIVTEAATMPTGSDGSGGESATGSEGASSEGGSKAAGGGGGRGKRPGGDSGGSAGGASSGGGSAPAAGGGSGASGAAPAAASKGSRDLDALLDGALGGGAPPAAAPRGGGSSPAAAPAGGGDSGGLPQTLSRSQVQAGMRTVAGAVGRCGRGESGRVTVDVVISGSGSVQSATVSGQFAGTPVGSCAARAVRGARFPRFRDASLTVRGYPFPLQ